MEDVNISKYRASVVREGSKPASPGFVVSEGQSPTDPAGTGQNHLPVTIAAASTALSITESQILSGAGTVSQYIRGDGSLADFPEASGGGSSVSYYLNGSVNQGTIGGVAYKELNKVPILGAGTDFTINANGYIASFITDAGDPNLLEIPGGNWNFETYFSANSGGGSPTFYVELYKYNGTTFTLLASNSGSPELIAFGTNITAYFSTLAVPTTTLALTDRLAVRYYVTHSGRTITLHTEDNHLCQIITTFTTGLTALNGLTAQVQNFAVGTSGTDFAIASATATHTFNLPTASATNRGALSSGDWTTFNNKQNALTLTTTGSSGAATLVGSTLNIPIYSPDLSGYVPTSRTITINGTTQDLSANRTFNVGTVTSVGLSSATSGVTIGSTPVTTSGTITLAIATASGSQNGLLSSTDWTTFNNKQNALTNPVTGTGTTNYLAKFTGSTTVGNSQVFDNGTNVGINQAIPTRTLDILGASGIGTVLKLQGASGTTTYLQLAYNGATNAQSGYIGYNSSSQMQFFTNDTLALTIDSNRNLGLGVTPSAWASTSKAIQFGTTGILENNNGGSTYFGYNAYRSSGGGWIYLTSSFASIFGAEANGDFAWYNAVSGIAGNSISFSERFRVTQSGDANFNGRIKIENSSTPSGGNAMSIGGAASGGYAYLQSWNSQPITLNPLGNNVLIGTTTDNGARLQVSGAGTFSDNVTITASTGNSPLRFTSTTASSKIGYLYADASIIGITDTLNGGVALDGIFFNSTTRQTLLFNAGNISMTINSSGNVGIGTTSPDTYSYGGNRNFLTLRATATNQEPFLQLIANGSGNSLIDFGNSTIRRATIIGFDGSHLAFFTNTSNSGTSVSEQMRITSGGNVLIGSTTDNGSKLQVNGAIRTAQPVGTTSNGWLLGRALVSGTSTPNRWIRVQIGLEYYDILAVYMGTL